MFAPAPLFVGPVVQSARFGGPETCQNWSKSFWMSQSHVPATKSTPKEKLQSAVPATKFSQHARKCCACLQSKLATNSKSSKLLHLPRNSTLTRLRHASKTNTGLWRDRSRCGAAHILRTRSEPFRTLLRWAVQLLGVIIFIVN